MSAETVAAAPTASLAARVPRELFRRSLSRSVIVVARTWLGIGLCWWAAGAFGPWAFLPAVLLIGTLQYHLNVLGHDGLHYLLSNSRSVNDALCRWLLHGPHGAPLGAMRRNHLNHHTQFGGESDLDRQYYDTRRHGSALRFLAWLWGSLAGGMTVPIARKLLGLGHPSDRNASSTRPASTPPGLDRRWLDLASVLVSQIWIAAAIWAVTGMWWAYAVLWALPLLSVMMGLNTMRSCLEHARPGTGSPGLHSFRSNRIERFFLSPFNMNVHAEHHLVPAVPWHQLPELRRFLIETGLYGQVSLFPSYVSRIRALAASLR